MYKYGQDRTVDTQKVVYLGHNFLSGKWNAASELRDQQCMCRLVVDGCYNKASFIQVCLCPRLAGHSPFHLQKLN